ncbi:hypothetical protein [Asanoa iriomotensis]|uniref:WD40 repeat protein n=1 Tax=Asanoa iriomotensis TaxID=234613 RepID=A0ABQ4C6D5_9ACTN|nr:hypothetical protein [Asanoa iriomotensis]GIF57850.1 hypothetical protein Air01nite_39450 [Asanoa iriomotensis]
MNDRMTYALRQTFEELASDSPPPPGLARVALRGARRRRRAQFGAGIGLAVCAALAGGLALGGAGGGGQQFASRPGGSVIAAYSGIRDPKVEDASPAFLYSLLLDRETGEYQRVPYRSVVPSPDGDQVLVGVGDNGAAHPTRVGVMDRESQKVRWMDTDQQGGFPGNAGDGEWSPDGRRIAFRLAPKTGPITVVVVDAETLRADFLAVPDFRQGDIRIGWTPDSAGFAITTADTKNEGSPYEAGQVQFYDLDGKQRRVFDVPDKALYSAPAFSAEGQLALSGPPWDAADLSIALADPETGAVRSRFALDQPGLLLGWVGEDRLLVRTNDGRDNERIETVDLHGRVISSLTPPEGVFAQQVYVGSADGLPDSAADLTF